MEASPWTLSDFSILGGCVGCALGALGPPNEWTCVDFEGDAWASCPWPHVHTGSAWAPGGRCTRATLHSTLHVSHMSPGSCLLQPGSKPTLLKHMDLGEGSSSPRGNWTSVTARSGHGCGTGESLRSL